MTVADCKNFAKVGSLIFLQFVKYDGDNVFFRRLNIKDDQNRSSNGLASCNLAIKNGQWVVLLEIQKQHFIHPCQRILTKLSLVKNYPLLHIPISFFRLLFAPTVLCSIRSYFYISVENELEPVKPLPVPASRHIIASS